MICNVCGGKYNGLGPAYICQSCLADAKLGRMVRGMHYATPEEALERAGVREVEL